MARRSHEQRRINQALREQAMTQPTLLSPDSDELDQYVAVEITRVRAHIARLNAMLDREENPQQLERLSRALNLLSERERILAGRPLPGAFKPVKPKPKPKPVYALPLDDAELQELA